MGLLISNKISHQLNEFDGGIRVCSELSKGSTFSFKIIDYLFEDKECLMTLSDHKIGKIAKMECKLLEYSNTFCDYESILVFKSKLSFRTSTDVNLLPDKKYQPNLSGSISNYTSKSSKYNVYGSFLEKSNKSSSSKYSKNHFFFAEAGTFKNFGIYEDYKTKEVFIDKKIDFITQFMRNKCTCPYILAVDDNDFNILL